MNVKNILKENNFKFEKKFGQNFLTDLNLLGSIVEKSGVNENSIAVEIGVGAGTLTGEIAKRVKKVYGFEIDKNLQPVLTETLSPFDNIEIAFQDIMKVNLAELESKIGGAYSVIANLPYYITTPIIMLFVENSQNCERVVVTVQKEVAERICAQPNTAEYGAITASINAICDCKIIKQIPRSMFYPVPNVDSAVVRIDFNKSKFNILEMSAYRKLVKVAFTMRRKTLVNNLIKGYNLSRGECENLLNKLQIDISVRGENLSPSDFVNLSNLFVENNIKCKGELRLFFYILEKYFYILVKINIK